MTTLPYVIPIYKEIIDTTSGQAPSFSSSVILKRNRLGNCIHSKELHFAVSLIGNFYQNYGLDITTILDDEDGRIGGYTSINAVTTSPHKEFADSFLFVEQKLQERYPDHKIIPFAFGQTIIRGLQVRYLDDEDCSINKALFNHFLEDVPRLTRGDAYYGLEQWQKKNK